MNPLRPILNATLDALDAACTASGEILAQNSKEILDLHNENKKLRERQHGTRCAYCCEVIDQRNFEDAHLEEIAKVSKAHVEGCKAAPAYQLKQLVNLLEKQNKVLIHERDDLKAVSEDKTKTLEAVSKERDKFMRQASEWQGEVTKLKGQKPLEETILALSKTGGVDIGLNTSDSLFGVGLSVEVRTRLKTPSSDGKEVVHARRVITKEELETIKNPAYLLRLVIEAVKQDVDRLV